MNGSHQTEGQLYKEGTGNRKTSVHTGIADASHACGHRIQQKTDQIQKKTHQADKARWVFLKITNATK